MKKRLLTAALAALSLGQTFAAERNPAVRPVMDWGRLTRGLSTLCMEESTRAPEPLAFPQRQLPTLTDAGIRDALQFLSTPLQTLVISFVEDEVFRNRMVIMNNTGTLALGIVLLQATGNIERELKSNSRLPLSDVFTIGWPSVPETLKLRLAFQWHGDSYVFEGTLSKTTFVMLRNNPSKAMMPFELCLEEEGKERAVELTKSSVAETVHPEKPAGESVNSA